MISSDAGPSVQIDPDRSKGWFRRLIPLIAARRAAFLVVAATGLTGLSIQVAVPMVLKRAVDHVVDAGTSADPIGDLTDHVLVLFVMAIASFGLRFAYRYLLFGTACRIENDLRSHVYRHLTRLSFSFYDRVAAGEVISRANSDIRSIQLLLAFGPLAALSAFSFFMALAFMLSIHVPLAVVTVATMPFVYVLGQKLRDRVFPLSWITQGRMAEVAMVVDENVNGTRVVKSFAAEPAQIAILARAANRLRWSATALIDARARFNPVIEALPRLGMVLVLLYGGHLVINGHLGVGSLLAFSGYVTMIAMPFRMFGFVLLQAQRAAASAIRIYEILDEEPEIVDRPGALFLREVVGRVEFRDVRFAYPGVDQGPPVLDGFNLTIEPGETVALVGRTGCGKSTVARLLARFYDVDAGTILVDGHDVRDLTLASLRSTVNQVPDEAFLFSESLHDNVAFGQPTASRTEVVAAARIARADEFVDEFDGGYDEMVGERGYTLSGGQRQRIALARSILIDPKILVLDDATSAIDIRTEEEIHQRLSETMADRTTIVIAHRLSTIVLADRIALMEGGRVVATGTHAELLSLEPRYAAILTHSDGVDEDDKAGHHRRGRV
ncbi:MAG TPA: ABC transporter ATP-binding protein [Acidimicrobiaceae bacterium]|nr:ABC transporter ATP-binding protein [Acidimicrobiaceae bacterium]HCV33116.1 ABC transporter ATP-binding protein [Acidimicrobiaceae bacterium]